MDDAPVTQATDSDFPAVVTHIKIDATTVRQALVLAEQEAGEALGRLRHAEAHREKLVRKLIRIQCRIDDRLRPEHAFYARLVCDLKGAS